MQWAGSELNGLSRRFYDVDAICRYIEGGVYKLELPRYKRQYVALISGPDEPQRRLLDRLDAIAIPETERLDWVRWAAAVTRGVNGLWYGRSSSAYISAKYGSMSYADRFRGFSFHLGGRLVVSND